MSEDKVLSKKALARKDKIKAVALELFLTKGYQETSLSDIIKLSKGSYSNIYDTFKSKEGLFFEILNDVCKAHFDTISSQIKKIQSNDLKEILHSFAVNFMEIFNQAGAVNFGKIIYSQAYKQDKEFANWIEKNQKIFASNILVEYFKKQENAYLAKNASKLAELFCIMLKEPHHTLNVLANTRVMNKKEQEKHIEFVIDFFIQAIKSR